MKPIVLDEKTKENLLKKIIKEFSEKIDNYTFEKEATFTFSAKIGEKCKDKLKIIYTPKAYLRMKKLVEDFSTEVSWFGLVEQKSPMLYRVYDVIVPKQLVNGGKVDTTDEDMLEFYENLTDEQAEHMRFQAHSHVNFSTDASGTDTENQMDMIMNIPGHEGFYIFQIWNKRDSINTYLYDLTNNIFYDKNDIELEIEDEDYGSLGEFIAESRKLVGEIKPVTAGKKKGQVEPYRMPCDYYQAAKNTAYQSAYLDGPNYAYYDAETDSFYGQEWRNV